MFSNISASIFTPTSTTFGSTPAKEGSSTVSTAVTVAPDASSPEPGITDIDVHLSAHIERLSENQSIAIANANDALTNLEPGSRRQVSPADIGASNRQYSLSHELGGVDYGSNVTTAGGPFDVIDKVLAALDEMGESALQAQSNLLPRDSAFWVSAQPSFLA